MKRKGKIRVAAALSLREKDFEAFRKEVYSSKRLKERVDLVPSWSKEHLREIIPDTEIAVCFSMEKGTFLSAKKLRWM